MSEVERCVESLKATDVRLASLTDVFAKLPTWCESLRRGTVQDVVDVVSTACSVFLNNKETTIAEFENMGEDEIVVVMQDLLSFSSLLAKGSKLPHFSEAGPLNRRTSDIVQMAKQGQKVAILQKALEEFVDDDGEALRLPERPRLSMALQRILRGQPWQAQNCLGTCSKPSAWFA